MEQNNSLVRPEHQITTRTGNKLDKHQVQLAKAVNKISLMGNPSFPLTPSMIEDYVVTLSDLLPELTPGIMKKMIGMMITGKIPYDVNKGILNITLGYNKYCELRTHYSLFNVETGFSANADEDDHIPAEDKRVWHLYNIRINAAWVNDLNNYKGINGFSIITRSHMDKRINNLKHCPKGSDNYTAYDEWLETVLKVEEREAKKIEEGKKEKMETGKALSLTTYENLRNSANEY